MHDNGVHSDCDLSGVRYIDCDCELISWFLWPYSGFSFFLFLVSLAFFWLDSGFSFFLYFLAFFGLFFGVIQTQWQALGVTDGPLRRVCRCAQCRNLVPRKVLAPRKFSSHYIPGGGCIRCSTHDMRNSTMKTV